MYNHFQITNFNLFFISQLAFILLNGKASQTLDEEDNWFVMFVMFLVFIAVISPLVNFIIKVYFPIKSIIGIMFEKTTPMLNPSYSWKWRLKFGGGVMNTGEHSMIFCCLFNTFWVTCPFVIFMYSKTSSHWSVTHFVAFSFELLVFNLFKVSHKWSFKVSSTNMVLGKPLGNLNILPFT